MNDGLLSPAERKGLLVAIVVGLILYVVLGVRAEQRDRDRWERLENSCQQKSKDAG